jgi:hypothetical protein
MPAQMGCLDWAARIGRFKWDDLTRAATVTPSGAATVNDVRLPFRPSLVTGRRLKRILYFDRDLRTGNISDASVLFQVSRLSALWLKVWLPIREDDCSPRVQNRDKRGWSVLSCVIRWTEPSKSDSASS